MFTSKIYMTQHLNLPKNYTHHTLSNENSRGLGAKLTSRAGHLRLPHYCFQTTHHCHSLSPVPPKALAPWGALGPAKGGAKVAAVEPAYAVPQSHELAEWSMAAVAAAAEAAPPTVVADAAVPPGRETTVETEEQTLHVARFVAAVASTTALVVAAKTLSGCDAAAGATTK